MGLFDTLRCEHPLPDGCTERDFQTKSLGCNLETYTLTPSGHLLRADGTDSGLHGVVRFYSRDSAHRWLEYEARFTDGAPQHLVPVVDATYTPEGTCPQPRRPRP